MRSATVAVVAFTALVLAPRAAQPQPPLWNASGPEGGAVYALALDPSAAQTAYAATEGGVFKSTDGGVSWSRASRGLDDGSVGAVALDPTHPQTLYAAAGQGISKSLDGAASWKSPTRGIPGPPGFNRSSGLLAVAPAAPRIVYAFSPGGWVGPTTVWRSEDGGRSWALRSATLAWANAAAVEPSNPRRLHIGTYKGLYRSVDGGRTWTRELSEPVASIVADPWSLYVGGRQGRTYSSIDSGSSWHALARVPGGGRVSAFAVDPASHVLWAGTSAVFRSVDGGRSWSRASPSLGDAVTAIAAGPGVALASGSSGIWRDDAGTFVPANTGLVATIASPVVADPIDPEIAYASVGRTIFATGDGGTSWRELGTLPVKGAEALSFAIDPSRHTTVYAAALVYPGPTSGLVLKSTDRGRSWKVVKQGIRAVAVVVDPSNPRVVYVGSIREGVFRSTDGGATWKHLGRGEPVHVVDLAVDPQRSGTLYAGTFLSKGGGSLYRSTDGGATWQELAGLPTAHVSAVAVDPHRPATVFTAMGARLYRSDDRGSSWQRVGAGLPPIEPEQSDAVRALAPDPGRAGVLYAGGSTGVFVTVDSGAHWRSASAGLPSRDVLSLSVGARGTRLFAGTFGNGVAVARLPVAALTPPSGGL